MDIQTIKAYLREHNLDAYIVAHGNRFIGQDILENEHKLKFLCGFSGSAGIMAITAEQTYLLVDGRYELQARMEVGDTHICILNQYPQLCNVVQILYEQELTKIAYDAWNHSAAEMEYIQQKYPSLLFQDIGDLVGIDTRTKLPVLLRDTKYCGATRELKIAPLVHHICAHHADYMLITAADSVSWLCNIYAQDLPYSPIVRTYALISKNSECILISDNIKTDLTKVLSWQQFTDFLQKLQGKTILYDAEHTPYKIKLITAPETLVKTKDICQIQKAVKNPTEIKGMINCHIRDGVAISKFLCWLSAHWHGLTELDVVRKLHEFRTEQALFFSESFATIAGSAEHGAIVHYQPNNQSNITLKENSLLLLDSGGQYLDGTTDITRTVALGTPTRAMIEDFTAVLKAHIALANACFPTGTLGSKLDTLARAAIWKHGADYKHGTGHGVACFGNVHEGPISISANTNLYGFEAHMVVSVEPGIYRANKYGIRIENLVYTEHNGTYEDSKFLHFIPLTKVPIDKHLIDTYLLSTDERAWLNAYHHQVYESLAPYMNEIEKIWLKDACSPL